MTTSQSARNRAAQAPAVARSLADAVRTCDAIVVGGSIVGLVTAYLLAQLGYRTRIVEKTPHLGAFDRSFTNRLGRRFDFGMHALDDGRSEVTTRLFRHVVDDAVHRVERRRAVILRNHVIPYNVPAAEWPDELRSILPEGRIVDRLATARPKREDLYGVYGREFTDLILDEGLESYPSDARHLSFGIEESSLLTPLYPWFFPRAERTRADFNESRSVQDRLREQPKEYVLYPNEGGFGGFAEGFQRALEARGVVITTGADDLAFDFTSDGHVRSVRGAGQAWTAPRVYWCAPIDVLARLLGREVSQTSSDRLILGSLQFERPVRCDYNELIVADPTHRINRISFPGKFAQEADDLVSIEFAFPKRYRLAELCGDAWRDSWVTSLRRLGIIDETNALLDFELQSFGTLYNAFGIEGRPTRDVLASIDLGLSPSSNLRPLAPSLGKTNINTRVPLILEQVAADLRKNPAS